MYGGDGDGDSSDRDEDKPMVSQAPTLCTTVTSTRYPVSSTPIVSKISRRHLPNFSESLSFIGLDGRSDITAASDDECLQPAHDSSLREVPVVTAVLNDVIQPTLVEGASDDTVLCESNVRSPSKKRQRRRLSVPESKTTSSFSEETVKLFTE